MSNVMSNVFDYANCFFGSMRFQGAEKNHDEDFCANLACTFHEEEVWNISDIKGTRGTFEECAMHTAKELAERAGLENVTIKKGGNGARTLWIYENGEPVVSVAVDLYIDDEDRNFVMDNGDTVGNIGNYGWRGLRRLERAAA